MPLRRIELESVEKKLRRVELAPAKLRRVELAEERPQIGTVPSFFDNIPQYASKLPADPLDTTIRTPAELAQFEKEYKPTFVDRATIAAVRATGLPEAFGVKEAGVAKGALVPSPEELKKMPWHKKIPEHTGWAAETIVELAALYGILTKAGFLLKLPKSATSLNKATEMAKWFGATTTIEQGGRRLFGLPSGGAPDVVMSMGIGTAFSLGLSGIGALGKKIFIPSEKKLALKVLGLNKNAKAPETQQAIKDFTNKFRQGKVSTKDYKITQELYNKWLNRQTGVIKRAASKPVQPPTKMLTKPPVRPSQTITPAKPAPKVAPVAEGKVETGKPQTLTLYRGTGAPVGKEGYVSDPGDLGAGEYWTTSQSTAKSYGPDVKKQDIELKNPLVIDSKRAAQLADSILKPLMEKGQVERAQKVTKNLLAKGYDSVVVEGYDSPPGEYTVVLLRPAPTPSALERKPAGREAGFVDLAPIADAGEQIAKRTVGAHKLVTRFTGIESKLRKSLIQVEEQEKQIPKIAAKEGVKLFRHLSHKESLQALLGREKGQASELPDKLQGALKDYEKGIAESGAILKELGYTADWPNNVIRYLKERLKTVKGHKAELITQRIEKLSELSYVHHAYKPEGIAKKAISLPKRITKRPGKLLGRKYDTLEDAIKAGKKPSHIATSYAEMVAEARRAKLHNELIEAINQNTKLALPESKAPNEWSFLDERAFPASKKQSAYIDKKGRARIKTTRYRYHPALAEAIVELTYAPSGNLADRAVRASYDRVNAVMKHILFYNPVIMTKNDIFQAWRATGLGFVVKLPRAIKAVSTKNKLYNEFRRAGLYNSVIDYTPSAKMLTDNMIEHIRRTRGEKAAHLLGHYINPYNILKDTKHLLDHITWGGDKIWRTAVAMDLTGGSFFSKGLSKLTGGRIKPSFIARNKLSRFETIELANDFMANYGKVPKNTRKWANRFFFTPTYRISMARMLAKMWASPKKFWPQLARHYAYKLFVWYVLPGLIGAWVYGDWKSGRGEKGYKIVLTDPKTGREKVYSLSDPLLEEAKMTQRPILQSFEFNIAAVPHAIMGLLRKPKYKNKRDKYGHLFRLGTPIIRDVANMQDEDKTTAEKILTALAVAYVYERRGKEQDEEKAIESFAKALSIWTDWKEQKEDIQKRLGGTPKKTYKTSEARKRARVE